MTDKNELAEELTRKFLRATCAAMPGVIAVIRAGESADVLSRKQQEALFRTLRTNFATANGDLQPGDDLKKFSALNVAERARCYREGFEEALGRFDIGLENPVELDAQVVDGGQENGMSPAVT